MGLKGSKQVPVEESYYMGCLFMQAAWCRDPEIQKAALFVDGKRDVITFGCNTILTEYPSAQAGWNDRDYSLWSAEDTALDQAIRRRTTDWMSSTLYVLNPPTHHATGRCLALGVKKITYLIINDQWIDQPDWKLAQKLAKERKIELKAFEGNLSWIRDRIMKYDYLF